MRPVWQLITGRPPRPLVLCLECGASELNESDLLDRGEQINGKAAPAASDDEVVGSAAGRSTP